MKIVIDDVEVTLEDLARAWASLDGKEGHFDKGKNDPHYDDYWGHYDGYMIETREVLNRAIRKVKMETN